MDISIYLNYFPFKVHVGAEGIHHFVNFESSIDRDLSSLPPLISAGEASK